MCDRFSEQFLLAHSAQLFADPFEHCRAFSEHDVHAQPQEESPTTGEVSIARLQVSHILITSLRAIISKSFWSDVGAVGKREQFAPLLASSSLPLIISFPAVGYSGSGEWEKSQWDCVNYNAAAFLPRLKAATALLLHHLLVPL